MRAWAIDALGKIGSRKAVPTLIELLGSPEEGFRRLAAIGLGAIGDPRAVPALEQAARHDSWRARRLYRRAIRQIAS
ncbi:MAG: HEAT repeat domain-containing protein [Gaiellaceae bacterium]